MIFKGHNYYLSEEDLFKLAQNETRNALTSWSSGYKKKHVDSNKSKTSNHFDIFFPNERHIHSVIQSGLTSFGTKLWEQLSYKIAELNGFETFDKKEFNSNVPKLPKNLIDCQQAVRKKVEKKEMNLTDAIEEIRSHISSNSITSEERDKIKGGAGIDFWFKKDGCELIGDIKSPQENVGNSKKLVEHILIWCTHRLLDEPDTKINAVIAFPYNPFRDLKVYMEEQGNKVSVLNHGQDILLGDDFWNKLSGIENSTDIIFKAFESLSDSTELNEIKKFFLAK